MITRIFLKELIIAPVMICPEFHTKTVVRQAASKRLNYM